MSDYHCIIIEEQNHYTQEDVARIIAEMNLSGKGVMIVGVSMTTAICMMIEEDRKQAEELKRIIIECKEPYDCRLDDDEPNETLPYTETRKDVRPLRQHVIWDYG